MTVFAKSARFSFTALNKGGVLWKEQGREENGKERKPEKSGAYEILSIFNKQ